MRKKVPRMRKKVPRMRKKVPRMRKKVPRMRKRVPRGRKSGPQQLVNLPVQLTSVGEALMQGPGGATPQASMAGHGAVASWRAEDLERGGALHQRLAGDRQFRRAVRSRYIEPLP
jgi:hypothetical protein